MFKRRKSIFITKYEKSNSAHFEFRHFSEQIDSLYVPINQDIVFFKEYLKYLEPTKTPNGATKFDACGINYYTKEQAQIMYEKIQNDKPKDHATLLSWLEKVISSTSEFGFYLRGV